MLSRFPGFCADCGGKIAAGAEIDYDRATRRVTCAECAPPPVAEAPAVIRVSLAGEEVAFQLEGRLGGDGFRAFRAALGTCRFRDGVNYVAKSKAAETVAASRAAGLILCLADDVQTAIEAHARDMAAAIVAADERTIAVDAILAANGAALYKYQKQGVAWLAPRTGALVADDMGLGKTIQAITAIPEGAPVVVVCPAVAKSVWQRETAKWRPAMKVSVLSGRGSFRAPVAGEMVCVNYDILPDAAELAPGTVLILDEAHACASSKAKRTVRVRALSEQARRGGGKCWALTATPLKNNPLELWGVLETAGIAREAFGSWTGFLRAFNGEKKGRFGGYKFGRPTEAAAECLRRVSIRRVKSDVLSDLPAKTYRTLPATIDRETAKLCDAALAEVSGEEGQLSLAVEKAVEKLMSSSLGFAQLSAARAALAKAKIPAMLEVVESYEKQGEPLVVFSAYRAPIDLLGAREGWATITGDTSNERRGEIVEAFQAGRLKGVACTIRAGGVAITLTRASNVLRVDREWNPALNVQAEDRCYRIGQKSAVLVTDLVAEHKLDEMIAATIARKEALISGSVDASTVQNIAPAAAAPVIDWAAIEAEAAQALREAAEAVKAAENAKSDNARRLAERRAENAKYQARARVRAAAARRLSEEETEADAPRRGPRTELESWAIAGLRVLAENDPDRAKEKNDIGFNATDGSIGHALAWLPDLTDQEWRLAVRIARVYHRQIGEAPKVAA
jgi:superfamily II DNA or RNA helicase